MERTNHYSTVYNSQDMEATKGPSTEEWIKKMWCLYTIEYYSSIKKNEIMPFAATLINLQIIILSEISHTNTNIVTSHVESRKIDSNELNLQNRNRLTDIEGERINKEFGISRYI